MYGEIFGQKYAESTTLSFATGDNILFNSYSLQNGNVITQKITMEDFPAVEYQDFNIPRGNGMGLLSKFYRRRTIRIDGILKADTELNLLLLIDAFKMNMSKTSGIFKYKTQGEYRQISATCTDLKINRSHYNITFIPFSLTLTTTDSFFYLASNQSISDSGSNSPRTIEINNTGTAISLPQIYMTFSGVGAPTSVSLTLNGVILTYTATTIVNGDILVFDCLNKIVTLNGVSKEYGGTFPQLELGTNSLIFTINSTFTCNYSIAYRKNFL